MEKEILSIEVDEEFGTTEVLIRVPDFDNLGHRLNELEQLAFEADPGEDDSEEEGESADPKADLHSEESRKQRQKRIDSLPDGPEKEALRAVHENVRKMKELLETGDRNDESEDDPEDELLEEDGDEEGEHDLQLLVFAFPEGVAWDEDSERKVDRFLANWPKLKAKVLNATYEIYQAVYPVVMEFVGADPGVQYFLPKPNGPESIANNFSVETVYFRSDKKIGLSGYCTWDDEHGWGVLLKDGAVIGAGGADEAFD